MNPDSKAKLQWKKVQDYGDPYFTDFVSRCRDERLLRGLRLGFPDCFGEKEDFSVIPLPMIAAALYPKFEDRNNFRFYSNGIGERYESEDRGSIVSVLEKLRVPTVRFIIFNDDHSERSARDKSSLPVPSNIKQVIEKCHGKPYTFFKQVDYNGEKWVICHMSFRMDRACIAPLKSFDLTELQEWRMQVISSYPGVFGSHPEGFNQP